MEELIRQAFLHIDVIGPHVADGHYDLVGPNGDIILPQVWDTVVEPDWTITMHMWPIPEKPKTPEPPPAPEAPPEAAEPPPAPEEPPAAPEESPPAPEAPEAPEPTTVVPADEAPAAEDAKKAATGMCTPFCVPLILFGVLADLLWLRVILAAKKQRQKTTDPGAFAMWMVGGHRLKTNKNLKVEKKGLK